MSQAQSAADDLFSLVSQKLDSFNHSSLQQPLSTLNALKQVMLQDDVLHVQLTMPFAWHSPFQQLQQQLTPELLQLTGCMRVQWQLQHQIARLKHAGTRGCQGVKNILAISSGKGGVGKSTTAVNLALALQGEGARVGLLDADIYGPSLPEMLGTASQQPSSSDGKLMNPIMAYGLATNSIGYLVTDDNALIWRGPMASKALMQLLNETRWPELDYLVIDLPPGTGDIQLTLAQTIPVTGAMVVTTPQAIALLDARKGIVMFNKVSVPVLGIIENMSVHICRACGHQEAIFGHDGAEELAVAYDSKVLAKIPLDIRLREDLDAGIPTVTRDPQHPISLCYLELANQVSAQLYWQTEVIPEEIAVTTIS
jgi:ATP-binding protein involved in chromosome partitioning